METSLLDFPATKPITVAQQIGKTVERRIAASPQRLFFRNVSWRYAVGRLTLSGYVPSYYAKQLLQELLRGIHDVTHIVNQVRVMSSTNFNSKRIASPS